MKILKIRLDSWLNQSNGDFSSNTKDNPKNESFKAIELRNKKVFTPVTPKVTKGKVAEVARKEECGIVENENNGVVENVKKCKNIEGQKN